MRAKCYVGEMSYVGKMLCRGNVMQAKCYVDEMFCKRNVIEANVMREKC